MRVETGSIDSSRERYLGRRLLAFCIDLALVWTFVAVAMGVLVENPLADDLTEPHTTYSISVSVSPTVFRPPIDIGSRTCGKPGAALSLLQDHFAPATIATAEICYERSYGLLVGSNATVVLAETPEAGDLAGQLIEVPITIHNASRYSGHIALAAFVVFSALCLWIFGATPGKKLMWLRVIGRRPIPALRREVFRMSPFLVTGMAILALDVFLAPEQVSRSFIETLVLGADVAWLVLVGLVWIWPLSAWRGGFFHDRWLGLAVVDPDDQSSDPPEDPRRATDRVDLHGGAKVSVSGDGRPTS